MPLTVILPSNLNKVDRQIRALEAVIPKDTEKDKVIHQEALKKLKEHREFLLESEVC